MKNMKKVIALMLALVMCLCFAACGSGEDNATSAPAEGTSAENTPVSSDTSLEDVKKSGKLTIATSPDFPPFESLEGDKVVGIEIDLLEMIAEKLGVELEINQMDFDSVLPGIQSGKFNVGVSGITVTEDRKKNADFTVPYFAAAQAIVVLKDSPIKSKADLEGKKVSVQTGTTAEEYCMKNGYDVSAFQANNDALSALTSGKVDAWVIDNETGIQMSETTNGKTVVLDEPMTTEPYSFAFKKGSTSLVNEINSYVEGWLKDGTIEKIFEKYNVKYVAPEA
ncbi:MAG: ABC transporter substrate-binding protein [Oscillospiraceae bacterium]|nr:ABC transporter substrate-binding protein [Oscillospiraceae bacterium]MDY5991192.1 ABC transporter substrate-binding protein [Oscillospiraceae bacterium]